MSLYIPKMSDTPAITIPGLAANFDVLAGSRIVDHNLDVVDPPNGYYARWENGLQVCWRRRSNTPCDLEVINRGGISWAHQSEYWDYPAIFAISPVVVCNADLGTPRIESHKAFASSRTRCILYFGVDGHSPSLPTTIYSDSVFAIGTWK